MIPEILPSIDTTNTDTWFRPIGSFIDRSACLRVSLSSPLHNRVLSLLDLHQALLRNRSCRLYTLTATGDHYPGDLILQHGSARHTFEFLEGLEWTEEPSQIRTAVLFDAPLQIERDERASWNLYSPLHPERLPRLNSIPKRWTARHAARALSHQQYEPGSLRCDGQMTDDYAYDAAYDFQRGPLRNPGALIQDLVERARSWSCSSDGPLIQLWHGMSSTYSFRLALHPSP